MLSKQREAEQCAVVINGNEGMAGVFTAEPDSFVTAQTLRILVQCDALECVTWSMSNVDHGLIWLDEHGKLKELEAVAVLKDGQWPSFALDDYLVGDLVFTGPTDKSGECHWLTAEQADGLIAQLQARKTVLVNSGSYLELIRGAD